MFGYMDWMIIAKWTTDFTHRENLAPSIISNMIDMALNGGAIAPGTAPIIGSASTQQTISIVFLLIALICTPIMLFPKPYVLIKEMQEHEHKAAHDDVHNKQSVHLQEQPLHAITANDDESKKPLVSVEHVEYQAEH
jgi:hypothetical protein